MEEKEIQDFNNKCNELSNQIINEFIRNKQSPNVLAYTSFLLLIKAYALSEVPLEIAINRLKEDGQNLVDILKKDFKRQFDEIKKENG